ncbi:unnamed protein product [Pleuronectes platessa]|uniref:Uncharacterized protein n=1 Tax=Pleuronectes platessa TaxID=8262 RepID=A0A9N7V4U4_PLEPL|nr:unnamed protein product [Pleuronectes platessa]
MSSRKLQIQRRDVSYGRMETSTSETNLDWARRGERMSSVHHQARTQASPDREIQTVLIHDIYHHGSSACQPGPITPPVVNHSSGRTLSQEQHEIRSSSDEPPFSTAGLVHAPSQWDPAVVVLVNNALPFCTTTHRAALTQPQASSRGPVPHCNKSMAVPPRSGPLALAIGRGLPTLNS